jgi:replicative DNA helicase
MIQLQILSKIITEKSFDFVVLNNLGVEHFSDFEEEFSYISYHYYEYGNIPDERTITDKFKHLTICECTESDRFLLGKLQEDFLFRKGSNILNELQPIFEADANEGVEFLLQRLPELTVDLRITGTDLVKNADKRFNEYSKYEDLLEYGVIPSGFPEMDEILYGWLGYTDVVVFLSRINEGKSWIIAKSAAEAWKAGKNVCIYNSEMDDILTGYRVDTSLSGISNKALFLKDKTVGKDYKKHIEKMKQQENCFIVVTPDEEDLGGELTPSKIKVLIEKFKLDVFFIDQYSGLTSDKYIRDRKERYTHIAKELVKISRYYNVPIIGAVQANRKSVEGKDDEAMPEMENVSDADEIAALCTRMISLRNLKAGLKFKIIKNRYGKKGDSFLYFWDIDKGIFKFIPDKKSSKEKKIENKKKFKDKTSVF